MAKSGSGHAHNASPEWERDEVVDLAPPDVVVE